MRKLYEVHVVDPAGEGALLFTAVMIAKDKASAERKLIFFKKDTFKKDLDDYDFIVIELGDVRPRQEIQEAKVVEE